jgi:hypothetical protein
MFAPTEGFFCFMSTNDFANVYNKSVDQAKASTSKLPKFSLGNRFKNVNKKHFYIGGVIILLVVAFLAGRYFAPQSTLGAADARSTAPTPRATQMINRNFEFPLLDANGKQVSKISYLLQSANLQDSFIYQGKLATAVKGRTFLIFDLKLTNPYTKTVQINSRDYLRVKMNGSDELLAPEIHNDPVEVQANSTKYTRIGLPINDTDKDIILLVGDINGKKEEIKLNLEK